MPADRPPLLMQPLQPRKYVCLKLGFTLVELLVVVGIIAILISLLLPALSSARRAADTAACVANLHNLGLAIQSYEYSNHGLVYLGASGADSILFSQTTRDNSATSTPAKNSLRVCPALRRYASSDNDDLVGFTSYGWNAWVISWLQQPVTYSGSPAVCLKRSRVTDASECVLLADTIYATGTGISLNTSMNEIYDPYEANNALNLAFPDFHGRHGGRGAVLWMDLHASTESPVDVPPSATNFPAAPSVYRANHVGYLCRSGDTLKTMSAEYYFVFNKFYLPSNSMSVYHNYFNKSAW